MVRFRDSATFGFPDPCLSPEDRSDDSDCPWVFDPALQELTIDHLQEIKLREHAKFTLGDVIESTVLRLLHMREQ